MHPSPRILMCPPDHYGIEYEINPWMNRSMASVRDLAFKQWRELRDALLGLGVRIEEMTPQAGLPDLVFTANAGLMFRERFFSSRLNIFVLAHSFFTSRSPSGESSSENAAWQAATVAGGCEVEKRNGRARKYKKSIRSRDPQTYPPITPIATSVCSSTV